MRPLRAGRPRSQGGYGTGGRSGPIGSIPGKTSTPFFDFKRSLHSSQNINRRRKAGSPMPDSTRLRSSRLLFFSSIRWASRTSYLQRSAVYAIERYF